MNASPNSFLIRQGRHGGNGVIDETVRANMIMGDMCETIMELLDVGGKDRGLQTANAVSLEGGLLEVELHR